MSLRDLVRDLETALNPTTTVGAVHEALHVEWEAAGAIDSCTLEKARSAHWEAALGPRYIQRARDKAMLLQCDGASLVLSAQLALIDGVHLKARHAEMERQTLAAMTLEAQKAMPGGDFSGALLAADASIKTAYETVTRGLAEKREANAQLQSDLVSLLELHLDDTHQRITRWLALACAARATRNSNPSR